MKYSAQPIRERDANQIAAWTYDAPYAMYSLSALAIPALLDPLNRYHSVEDGTGELVGYCCFGVEATAPGGDYTASEPEVIDVGLGMHPGLVGKGRGKVFIEAILSFAVREFNPWMFRVSIAEFNQRSQRAFLGLGFMKTHHFDREGDGMRFVQLEREARAAPWQQPV